MTFDHEHVPPQHLEQLEAAGVAVRPGPSALFHAQDKVHMRAANHLTVRVSEALVKECEKIVDGLYVGTVKQAGLRAAPEPRWKSRNGG